MINAETKTLLFVLALLGTGYYILTIYENKVAIFSKYFKKQVSLWATIVLASFRMKFSD